MEQFLLARDVPAVAFRQDVFAHRGDGFSGDDFTRERGLDGDFEHLPRQGVFDFFDDFFGNVDGFGAVAERGHGVDDFTVDEDVEATYVGELPTGEFVIEGGVTAGARFELVGEIRGDFAQREFVAEHCSKTVELRMFQGLAAALVA